MCAAWIHDIGYAPEVAASGFHPLDGARFLAAAGVSQRLADLVAHHSCATQTARRLTATHLIAYGGPRGGLLALIRSGDGRTAVTC